MCQLVIRLFAFILIQIIEKLENQRVKWPTSAMFLLSAVKLSNDVGLYHFPLYIYCRVFAMNSLCPINASNLQDECCWIVICYFPHIVCYNPKLPNLSVRHHRVVSIIIVVAVQDVVANAFQTKRLLREPSCGSRRARENITL